MPEIKAYDVVYLDSANKEPPFEVTWFYHSMEEAKEQAETENERLRTRGGRYWVFVLREREMKT